MTDNEKIIKIIYEGFTFPLDLADKIQDALLKTEPMKLRAFDYASFDNDRSDIECSCPRCLKVIRYEYLDNDIYCEGCGQLLTDWDELLKN